MFIGFSILALVIVVFISTIYSGLTGIAAFAEEAGNVELINKTIQLFESYNIQEPLTEAGLNQAVIIVQNLVFSTPQIVLSLVVLLFMLYYFIKYGEEIIRIIRGIVPPTEMKYFDQFLHRVDTMMKAIYQSQLISSLIQNGILFFFMIYLRTPFVLELTIINFLLTFFNISVSIVPFGLNVYYLYTGYLTGDYTIFIITVIFNIIITSIDNLLRPFIGEKRASFNPVFFILGLTGGAFTLGFTGFIVGPLIFGMLQAALEILYKDKRINFV
jgi:predicted PurR-regulated permease PerM